MSLGQSKESLEKKGVNHPWSQTHSQRLDLVRDLDHLSDQFLDCEMTGCHELKDIYLDGVLLVVALKEPKAHWDFKQCVDRGGNQHKCMTEFAEVYNRWYPIMDRKLQDKRKNPGPKKTPMW